MAACTVGTRFAFASSSMTAVAKTVQWMLKRLRVVIEAGVAVVDEVAVVAVTIDVAVAIVAETMVVVVVKVVKVEARVRTSGQEIGSVTPAVGTTLPGE